MQAYVERLQIELAAKDKDIKRLEDNLGYLRLEHSKLREEIAPPAYEIVDCSDWGVWKRQAAVSQK